MIDEQQPVDMIDLVLESDGEQAVGFDGLLAALLVGVFDREPRGPADVFPEIGNRETAFVVGRLFFGCRDDLRD